MIEKFKNSTILVLIAFGILLPAILFGQLPGVTGVDTFFHIPRYMDAAMQIKTGHFSYFQQFFTLNNSGKIVNALYGPMVAYIQGALLNIFHFNGVIWYYSYLFQINLIGISSMYWLLRQNSVEKNKAFLISSLYILAGLVTATSITATYSFGYAFFPIIISAAIRLVNNPQKPVKIGELVIGITALAQTHMLSMLLGLLIYFFAFIWHIFRVANKKTILKTIQSLLISVILVLLLNFNVYGAYLEVTHSNPNLIYPAMTNYLVLRSKIDFLEIGFGTIPGFVLIIFILIWMFKINSWKQQDEATKFSVIIAIVFLFLSMGFINIHGIPGSEMFQFYARFFVVTYVLGLYLVGRVTIDYKYDWVKAILMSLVLVTGLTYWHMTLPEGEPTTASKEIIVGTINYISSPKKLYEAVVKPINFTKAHFLSNNGATIGAADYLPNTSQFKINEKSKIASSQAFGDYFTGDVLNEQKFVGSNLQKKVTDNGLKMTWDEKSPEHTLLPVIKYAHSVVELNGHKLKDGDYEFSNTGALVVAAKEGKNTLKISYKPQKLFAIGIYIQLVSIVGLFLYLLFRKLLTYTKKHK